MDLFKELRKNDLRKRAIDELIEAQNKIINDCKERYNFYTIQLEKVSILESIVSDIINNEEEKNRFNEEINSALNEAKQAIELRNKLEYLK